MLLLNYLHQPADTPYKASHAIFVREWAETPYRGRWTRFRTCFESGRFRFAPSTLRATWSTPIWSAEDELKPTIERLFANPEAAYIHAHYAKRGCYAARIDRA